MLIALFEPQDRPLGFAASPAKNGKRKADEMEEDTDGGVGGWIYTGSHNFSSAAWVRLTYHGSQACAWVAG
jgi:tyrosyl-DNA phosphodiesterase-1